MAGGKETPRQKMIGMMYLVLTALLALQVSNTVLEKFIFINRSLENTVNESTSSNTGIVARIQKQVTDAGDRKADVAVLDKAREIRERTKKVISELNDIKATLVAETGGVDPEDGVTPLNINDEEVMANMMVVKGRGEELKETLNSYAAFLEQKSGVKIDPIAYSGAEHPLFSNDPNQKRKSFAELNFAQTPLVAGLATITQYETEVLMREQAALDQLARSVGAEDVKFDKIVPMVRPDAKVVAAGTKYVAQMFIAASSSNIDPDMFVNGKKIPVEGGFGKVEFPATASSYDAEGLSKQTYKAEIKVTLPGGRDTVYTETHEYFVAKPVIQVQSASVQALYLQCGNELNVQVPALGNNYQPNFSADGATVLEGNKRGVVTVVPNAKNVKLNVSSGGTFIGSENFGVRLVPKPDIIPTDGARELDQRQGIKAAQLGRLVMRADADASFKEFLPKDARFRVTSYTVYLARGNRPVQTQKVSGPEVNLRQWANTAKGGDRLVIEVTEVKRMNFRDQVMDVSMGTKTFTIPIAD